MSGSTVLNIYKIVRVVGLVSKWPHKPLQLESFSKPATYLRKDIFMTCSRCGELNKIKLMPDYSSTGVWCSNCGLGIMNVKREYPLLPQDLIDSIEGWNMLWDLAQNKKGLSREYFLTIFKSMGKYLAHQITTQSSNWYTGEFDETQKLF